MSQDCCSINYSKNSKRGDLIVYCPLHQAAPALLKALKAIQRGFADGSIKWTSPRQHDTQPYHEANTLMCEAIATAEGRG